MEGGGGVWSLVWRLSNGRCRWWMAISTVERDILGAIVGYEMLISLFKTIEPCAAWWTPTLCVSSRLLCT